MQTLDDHGLLITDGFASAEACAFFADTIADPPLGLLPPRVRREAIARWAMRDDVFFLVAQREQRLSGYVLAQAVGPRPWRTLLSDWRDLPHALVALLRMRLGRGGADGDGANTDDDRPAADTLRDVLSTAWAQATAANVEFIYVDPESRSHGVARHLLAALRERLLQAGRAHCFAYIAFENTASIRSFRGDGWTIYRDAHFLRAHRAL